MEQMKQYTCEVLIIGSGPAGCSAAIYYGRTSKDTIVLDGKQESALFQTKEILNYPVYRKKHVSELLKKHAKSHNSIRMIG
jgi:thioredoxin reductase (NADPH)